MQQVLLYVKNNAINLVNLDVLVKILEDAFDNLNGKATTIRQLRQLRQRDKDFSAYLADF